MTEREAIARWHEDQAKKQHELGERQHLKGNVGIAEIAFNVSAFHQRSAASIRRGAGQEHMTARTEAVTNEGRDHA